MKKLITVAAGLIALVGASSCRGDYTCTCTFNGNVVYEQESSNSRNDAETDCSLKKTTVVGQTWDCDLR
jgi:hypothetical protein